MPRRDANQWYELLTGAYADYFENGTISVNKWWKTRVAAERGLISCGAEAIPYAVELLANRDPEIREDGAAVLGALGEDERVVDALLGALQREDEDQPRDVMIIGLGRLRNKKAIPFLVPRRTATRASQRSSRWARSRVVVSTADRSRRQLRWSGSTRTATNGFNLAPWGGCTHTVGDRDLWACCLRRERETFKGWSVYGAEQAQPVAISGKSPDGDSA